MLLPAILMMLAGIGLILFFEFAFPSKESR